ncbi:MAG TPA: hypothetical protein VEW48_14495 [Thermoanaerobaculia bacterium]|nr:hypothetical protein [Thermoanaerobaculia bacterium]
MSKKISPKLTAIAFAAALTLAGTAEAGPLFTAGDGTEASLWSQAWEWLGEVWGDLTGLQSATATEGITPPPTTTSDAGCGIDPNGQCGG